MREILFRGKRLDNGEWVHGFYVFAPNHFNHQEHLIQPVDEDGRLTILRKVHPESVGQFTGVFDKNGKRIFEGDICRINNMNFKVVFAFPMWNFVSLSKKHFFYPFLSSHCGKQCEIVGNIYDNPELLEEENGNQ